METPRTTPSLCYVDMTPQVPAVVFCADPDTMHVVHGAMLGGAELPAYQADGTPWTAPAVEAALRPGADADAPGSGPGRVPMVGPAAAGAAEPRYVFADAEACLLAYGYVLGGEQAGSAPLESLHEQVQGPLVALDIVAFAQLSAYRRAAAPVAVNGRPPTAR